MDNNNNANANAMEGGGGLMGGRSAANPNDIPSLLNYIADLKLQIYHLQHPHAANPNDITSLLNYIADLKRQIYHLQSPHLQQQVVSGQKTIGVDKNDSGDGSNTVSHNNDAMTIKNGMNIDINDVSEDAAAAVLAAVPLSPPASASADAGNNVHNNDNNVHDNDNDLTNGIDFKRIDEANGDDVLSHPSLVPPNDDNQKTVTSLSNTLSITAKQNPASQNSDSDKGSEIDTIVACTISDMIKDIVSKNDYVYNGSNTVSRKCNNYTDEPATNVVCETIERNTTTNFSNNHNCNNREDLAQYTNTDSVTDSSDKGKGGTKTTDVKNVTPEENNDNDNAARGVYNDEEEEHDSEDADDTSPHPCTQQEQIITTLSSSSPIKTTKEDPKKKNDHSTKSADKDDYVDSNRAVIKDDAECDIEDSKMAQKKSKTKTTTKPNFEDGGVVNVNGESSPSKYIDATTNVNSDYNNVNDMQSGTSLPTNLTATNNDDNDKTKKDGKENDKKGGSILFLSSLKVANNDKLTSSSSSSSSSTNSSINYGTTPNNPVHGDDINVQIERGNDNEDKDDVQEDGLYATETSSFISSSNTRKTSGKRSIPASCSPPSKRNKSVTYSKKNANGKEADCNCSTEAMGCSTDRIRNDANHWFTKIFTTAKKNKIINIVTSKVPTNEDNAIETFCKTFRSGGTSGIKFVYKDTVDRSTTVCITLANDNDKDKASLSTIKVITSSILGIPMCNSMVGLSWIKACEKESNFVMPTSFIRSLPSNVGTSEDSVSKLASVHWKREQSKNSVSKLLSSDLLFHNTYVFLCGTYAEEKERNLVKLLKAGSAHILKTATDVLIQLGSIMESLIDPKLYSAQCKRLVVLCGTGSDKVTAALQLKLEYAIQTEAKDNVYIVDSNWVSVSIQSAEMLAPANFKPASSDLIKLWNFSKQMKQNV
jgi:hypothetical protein